MAWGRRGAGVNMPSTNRFCNLLGLGWGNIVQPGGYVLRFASSITQACECNASWGGTHRYVEVAVATWSRLLVTGWALASAVRTTP